MNLKLIEKDGKTWTRIKIGNNERNTMIGKVISSLENPVNKSSRYTYYEVEGDLLNKPKTEKG